MRSLKVLATVVLALAIPVLPSLAYDPDGATFVTIPESVEDLVADMDYRPGTPLVEGIGNFVKWYKDFYKVAE